MILAPCGRKDHVISMDEVERLIEVICYSQDCAIGQETRAKQQHIERLLSVIRPDVKRLADERMRRMEPFSSSTNSLHVTPSEVTSYESNYNDYLERYTLEQEACLNEKHLDLETEALVDEVSRDVMCSHYIDAIYCNLS